MNQKKYIKSSSFRHTLHKQLSRGGLKKGALKYVANLQENTRTEVQFQWSCKAALLWSQFGMRVLL